MLPMPETTEELLEHTALALEEAGLTGCGGPHENGAFGDADCARCTETSREIARLVLATARDHAETLNECVCGVGAQPCLIHPRATRTQEQKIAFRRTWDAQYTTTTEKSQP